MDRKVLNFIKINRRQKQKNNENFCLSLPMEKLNDKR
jgi:hypothetical protein